MSGQGVNNGLGATSVPLTSAIRTGTVLSTNGLDGGLYPPGLPVASVSQGDADARCRDVQPDTASDWPTCATCVYLDVMLWEPST